MAAFYQDRGMNWDLTIYDSPEHKFYPARIGTIVNGGTSNEFDNSGLQKSVSILLSKDSVHICSQKYSIQKIVCIFKRIMQQEHSGMKQSPK